MIPMWRRLLLIQAAGRQEEAACRQEVGLADDDIQQQVDEGEDDPLEE